MPYGLQCHDNLHVRHISLLFGEEILFRNFHLYKFDLTARQLKIQLKYPVGIVAACGPTSVKFLPSLGRTSFYIIETRIDNGLTLR